MPIVSLTEKSFRELETAYKIIHDTVWKQRQQPLDNFIDRMAMIGLIQFRSLEFKENGARAFRTLECPSCDAKVIFATKIQNCPRCARARGIKVKMKFSVARAHKF